VLSFTSHTCRQPKKQQQNKNHEMRMADLSAAAQHCLSLKVLGSQMVEEYICLALSEFVMVLFRISGLGLARDWRSSGQGKTENNSDLIPKKGVPVECVSVAKEKERRRVDNTSPRTV
jgi:hypothetical protein